MAILDGLKNAVAANVARSANNVAVNGLRSIVGNVFGVDLNPTNPAAKLTNRPTKFTTKILHILLVLRVMTNKVIILYLKF